MKCMLAFAGLACALLSQAARAEVQDCIEIVALPAVITQQGVHCFKQDLNTPSPTGTAITINANNVIIDLNGFKLGGLGAGADTAALGIFALDRQNITIRNGTIRGFNRNIFLDVTGDGSGGGSSGHLVEDMRIESARTHGIMVEGRHIIVRNNFVFGTGNGSSSVARGILAQAGSGISVTGNVVSGVTETNEANGILVSTAPGVVVGGNEVHDVTALFSRGISVASSPNSIIRDNSASNTATGLTGISADGASDTCRDNVVANFTNGYLGCEQSAGNLPLP